MIDGAGAAGDGRVAVVNGKSWSHDVVLVRQPCERETRILVFPGPLFLKVGVQPVRDFLECLAAAEFHSDAVDVLIAFAALGCVYVRDPFLSSDADLNSDLSDHIGEVFSRGFLNWSELQTAARSGTEQQWRGRAHGRGARSPPHRAIREFLSQ